MYRTIMRRGMYIVKAEADQIEKNVDMSIRAFETDVKVGVSLKLRMDSSFTGKEKANPIRKTNCLDWRWEYI